MEELLEQILNSTEVIDSLKEIAPKALETGERVVISGIETTGKVLECAIKDGKIVEHTAKTVQEGIKSTENVALSVISEGGECFKCLIKDGQIVKESAETIRYGIKTTGEIAKLIVQENGETIRNAISTIGAVSSDAIKGIVEAKTIKPKLQAQVRQMEIIIDGRKYLSLIEASKEHPELFAISAQKEIAIAQIEKDKSIEEKRSKYQGVAEILKTLGDNVEKMVPWGGIRKTLLGFTGKVADVLPSRSNKNNKQLSEVLVLAYNAQNKMSQISDPVVDSMKRMLTDAVESKDPVAIDITVKSIQKEWARLLPDYVENQNRLLI